MLADTDGKIPKLSLSNNFERLKIADAPITGSAAVETQSRSKQRTLQGEIFEKWLSLSRPLGPRWLHWLTPDSPFLDVLRVPAGKREIGSDSTQVPPVPRLRVDWLQLSCHLTVLDPLLKNETSTTALKT